MNRERSERISLARTPRQIARCFEVMRQLRPHFKTARSFVGQVHRQQAQGYLLALLETDGAVRAVAGYRYLDSLFAGKFLYVDDLVTCEMTRSQGFGSLLLDWLMAEASRHGCAQFQLDSGVQRFDAHRFYFKKRMTISAYHFTIPLPKEKASDVGPGRRRK